MDYKDEKLQEEREQDARAKRPTEKSHQSGQGMAG